MRGRSKYYMKRYSRYFQHAVLVFYQVLIPLIIFQFIRTLFFPSTFDIFLLTVLVLLYVANYIDLFPKK